MTLTHALQAAATADRTEPVVLVCTQNGGAIITESGPLLVEDSSFFGNTGVRSESF